MKSMTTEFKVGLFTLLAIGVVIYMFIILTPEIVDSESSNSYYTIVDNASGIVPKTHVRTNGVSVGRVEDVILESSHTKITFGINKAVKVPIGSKIEIRTRGFLGETFVEVVRAPDIGQYIEPGHIIPMNSDQVGMAQLIGIIGGIAKDIKKVSRTFADVIGTNEGKESVKNIIGNIESASSDLKYMLRENREGVDQIVANLNEFSNNLANVMNDENVAKLDSIIADFEQTMADVRVVSDKIASGEGTIGKLVNEDETIEELNAAVKDVREVISPANKLRVAVDYQGEIRGDKTTQNYLNFILRTRPDKFYVLGLTPTQRQVKDSTTVSESQTQDGVVTTDTLEKTKIERALKFNLQMAKRFGDLALRAGIFESTGGFAADYYFWRDRLRLSYEAYDWEADNEFRDLAYMRAFARIMFFDNLFAVVGINDITRKQAENEGESDKATPFVGIGLNFDDNDMKAVVGSAALAL